MIRSRNSAGGSYSFSTWNANQQKWIVSSTKVVEDPRLNESMVTTRSPFYPDYLGRFDCGNDWLHTKDSNQYVNKKLFYKTSTSGFDGTAVLGEPRFPPLGAPFQVDTLTDAQLDANGTSAIAKVEPTRALFAGSNFMFELERDGIPTRFGVDSWKDVVRPYRGASKEYLSQEFGWKLLTRDIKDFCHAATDAYAKAEAYRKNANVPVRARLVLSDDTDSVQWYSGDYSVKPSNLSVFAKGSEIWTKRNRTWFSGAFTYYLPMSSSNYDTLRRAYLETRKITGFELTPEVLWNAAPWSWAIDWMSNMGDIMHNASAIGQDGLVMRWGYSMAESVVTRSRSAVVPANGSVYPAYRLDSVWEHSVQQRKHATPYGFGFDMSGLTARQAAILAAIGLSRL